MWLLLHLFLKLECLKQPSNSSFGITLLGVVAMVAMEEMPMEELHMEEVRMEEMEAGIFPRITRITL